jgi:kelch-like protein 20
VLFAGGVDSSFGASKVVDIYDVLSNTWSTAQLSEARFNLAAGAVGNKILFAGGAASIGFSKTVDIYDVVSNDWTTAQLSEARSSLAGGGLGNKVLFAGGLSNTGVDSKTVDIYNVSSNSWTTARLSEARENLTAAAAGNKILFGGGNTVHWLPGGSGNIVDSGASKTVDIFDVSSNTWAATQLSEARENPAAAGSGNKILYAAGAILDSSLNSGTMSTFYRGSKTVDIFTLR